MDGWNEQVHSIRTDMAIEANEIAMARQGGSLPGVEVFTEQTPAALKTKIIVQDPHSGQLMGKVPGQYITLEAPSLRDRDRTAQEQVGLELAKELENMLNLNTNPNDERICFVVGLG
ncbi:MAG: GPR endopeptidase, partial [Bacillota bacterium]